jgi:hypothetical protein
MADLPGFFTGTEMPSAGWWEALWPDPASKTELRVSPQQVIAVVEPAGLKHVGLVEVPPYHYGAVFEKPN